MIESDVCIASLYQYHCPASHRKLAERDVLVAGKNARRFGLSHYEYTRYKIYVGEFAVISWNIDFERARSQTGHAFIDTKTDRVRRRPVTSKSEVVLENRNNIQLTLNYQIMNTSATNKRHSFWTIDINITEEEIKEDLDAGVA